MKVVFVNYHHLNSNSGYHIYNIARCLKKRGVECAVFVPNNKETVKEIDTVGLKVYNYSDINKVNFIPDIVHAWTPRERVRKFVESLIKVYKCPYIVHMEDNEQHLLDSTKALAKWKIYSFLKGKQDGAVPNHLSHPQHSKAFINNAVGMTVLTDKLFEFKPSDMKGLLFWPAYDHIFENLPPLDKTLKDKLGIGLEDKIIVYMGNVHSINIDEIFNLYLAIDILNKKSIPVKLIKTGNDHSSLFRIKYRKVSKHIIRLGFRPRYELPKLLSLADILVQPGRLDNFNNYRFPSKLPDYLVSGIPVILPAANIGLCLKDNIECLLLRDGGPQEIADKIELLLNDEEKRRQIGIAGQAFAKANFSWDKSASKLYDFYCEELRAL